MYIICLFVGCPDLEVSLVTFSYSLSMMDSIYPVVDRVTEVYTYIYSIYIYIYIYILRERV